MDKNEMISKIKSFKPQREFNPSWIRNGIDGDCIKFMETFGAYLCDLVYEDKKAGRVSISDKPGKRSLTTSQIRNFYGEVKRIEMRIGSDEFSIDEEEWKNVSTQFLLLKPKMAYNAARVLNKQKENKVRDFKEVIFEAYSAVESGKEFYRFSQLMEGILAFHKAYGGKD